MARYAVTFTRQVTQTATIIVEAASPAEAAILAEDTPTTPEHIVTSGDNDLDSGWRWVGDPQEITDRPRTDRRRLAAASDCDARSSLRRQLPQ